MLDLSHCELTHLSDGLLQLKSLRTLIAANNQFDDNSLPKEFGTVFAETLTVLSLGGNQVSAKEMRRAQH